MKILLFNVLMDILKIMTNQFLFQFNFLIYHVIFIYIKLINICIIYINFLMKKYYKINKFDKNLY